MAVHLPSDLISDVMRNADPARRGAAVARLQSAARAPAIDFAGAVDDVGRHVAPGTGDHAIALSSAPGATRPESRKAAAYQGFEHMVLRNLFETLLPEEASGSFGGGPAAGVWRSMAADQLAGVVAENGGIGIAEMIGRTTAAPGPKPAPQWPYFALDTLTAVRG